MPRTLLAFTDTPPVAAGHDLVDRYLQDMPQFSQLRGDLAGQAARLAQQLARTPEGRRAVQPFYILARAIRISEYPVDFVRIYETGTIDVSRDVAELAYLSERLKHAGIDLDLVYCDNEDGLSPWNIGIDRFKEVFRHPAAVARMPEALRSMDVEKIRFPSPEFRAWLRLVSSYGQSIRVEALRKAIYDSGLARPWNTQTRIVNFDVIRTTFCVYDSNGWEIENQALLDGRTSCPVCYPGPKGQRYKGREHHPIWNCFVDGLNQARSAAPVSGVLPVIREPLRARGQAAGTVDPGGRWLSDQLVGHLVRTGATRFMMFHPVASPADDIAMAEIFRDHEAAAPDAMPTLPAIPLDVDEVVTGDWRTTYEEFLKMHPDRWGDAG